MAKSKKTGGKKRADKEPASQAPSVAVEQATQAYLSGNFALLGKLHADANLTGKDRSAVDSLYEKTVTNNIPWMIAAGAMVLTLIVGMLTLR